ncbi:DUF5680 domain-containing protein [Bradyrhizobium sp. CCBAU 51765]|uniref:DUF5680 domain-containing protein n=1 Tax=Bradyrhizobium sp. CCBAU 51765 TaxID=1325102 RepID=UPI0018894127|nr:DUF5680 domain-containing protein [Bradyrhizobium sp. CCBAU 51765]QOZ08815.1 hypothetical protein XH96_15675 [Bradyrhizobium sp. CCBAU 51765]
MPSIPPDLAAFLVEAKRRTYAGLDDDATVAAPLLTGSKQLEHRAPPYAYRDIYFGMVFFVGQETVSRDERVIWSMSYSGGVRGEIRDRDTFLAIYKFLRQALLDVPVEEPYRGPRRFEQAGMVYRNEVEGALDRFHGIETIARHDGTPLFELRYGGGLLR